MFMDNQGWITILDNSVFVGSYFGVQSDHLVNDEIVTIDDC